MQSPSNPPLLLFAKAPIPGAAKTRLHDRCTPQQSASIADFLLRSTVSLVSKYWPGNVILSTAIDHSHPTFCDLQQQYKLDMHHQQEGDLGHRMSEALESVGYPAAVMGCDVPHITSSILLDAYQHLSNRKSVIGPAKDGGYYLLGLSRAQPELFTNQQWGDNSVLPTTLERAKHCQHPLHQLASLQDLDTFEDLTEVAEYHAKLRTYLERLGLI